MSMLFKAGIILFVSALTFAPRGVQAQEPVATDSAEALSSATPEATATPTSAPTVVTPSPTAIVEHGSAAVALRFVEEGKDAAPEQVQMFLVPWSDPGSVVELRTDAEARAEFRNMPPDTYTIRIYWPAGFAQPPASKDLPHILRIVVSVGEDGSVAQPDALPSVWPGANEAFDAIEDAVVLGPPPETIVLKRKDPGVLSISPSTGGGTVALAVGSIDVVRALRGELHLPDTGSASTDSTSSRYAWLLTLAGAAILGLVAVRQLRRRDARH